MIVGVGNREQGTGNSFSLIFPNFLESKKLEMQVTVSYPNVAHRIELPNAHQKPTGGAIVNIETI